MRFPYRQFGEKTNYAFPQTKFADKSAKESKKLLSHRASGTQQDFISVEEHQDEITLTSESKNMILEQDFANTRHALQATSAKLLPAPSNFAQTKPPQFLDSINSDSQRLTHEPVTLKTFYDSKFPKSPQNEDVLCMEDLLDAAPQDDKV